MPGRAPGVEPRVIEPHGHAALAGSWALRRTPRARRDHPDIHDSAALERPPEVPFARSSTLDCAGLVVVAFAREVLDRYFDHVKVLVGQALNDESLTPRERLRRYLEIITARLEADGFARGCLIGDFSLEAASLSEALRERLVAIFAEWRGPFEVSIAQAQAAGQISSNFAADDLADFLLASWEGAILRMKVERDGEPLERFKRIVFATVLKDAHG